MNIDTRHPVGKMDFDTEDRLLPNTHYRYGKNGRSGTSDKDGDGSVENIRGNVLRNSSFMNERGFVIGSCPDIRNNAVVYFLYVAAGINLNYTSAVVTNTSPAQVSIIGPDRLLSTGIKLKIVQGLNEYEGSVSGQVGNIYTLTDITGTLTTDPVTEILILSSLSQIVRYYESQQTFENLTNPVLMGDVLAFDRTKRIYNPRIIESAFGQLLTWTDGNVPPRLMNIDKMKQGGEYYATAADEQYINLAKFPPEYAPTIAYYYNPDAANYIEGKHYQFRYQYIFDDGQISTWGPISIISFSQNPNSYLGITVNTGHETVKNVRIAVREGNGDSSQGSVNPEWYIFNDTLKSKAGWGNNTNEEVLFFGYEQLTTVARVDSDKNFEVVPQKAGHEEVTDGNQIVLGDITEGYDNVDADITYTAEYRSSGIISYRINGSHDIELGNYSVPPNSGDTLLLRIEESVGVYRDSYNELGGSDLSPYPANLGARMVSVLFELGANYTYNAGTETVEYVSGKIAVQALVVPSNQSIIRETTTTVSNNFSNTPQEVISARLGSNYPYYVRVFYSIVAKNATAPGNLTVDFKVNGVVVKTKTESLTTTDASYVGGSWILANPDDEISMEFSGPSLLNFTTVQSGAIYRVYGAFNPYIQQGFKFNSEAEIGIVYYDSAKRSTGVCDPQTVSFVVYPQGGLSQYEQSDPTKGFIPSIAWAIKNIPPIEAVTYQFVYKGSSVSDFTYIVNKNQVVSGGHTVITYDTLNGYELAIGDQLRVVAVASDGNPEKYIWNNTSDIATTDTLHFIEDFDTSAGTISTDVNVFPSLVSAAFPYIIEIRKSAPKVSSIYFEFGQEYSIGNPGQSDRFHMGQTQNQDPNDPVGTPATGRIDNGDVYFRFSKRPVTFTHDDEGSVFIESFSISDDYESNFWDKGRINIETPIQRQQRIGTLLRWSGSLINNTQVNNLNVWDEGNYNSQINARNGDITGLRQIGYTLKIVQWSNINSAFLGRKQIQNADGSNQLVVTDSLIGTINPGEEELGTRHPGSIINTGRMLYFFDSLKAKMIVDPGNGLHEMAMFSLGEGRSTTMSQYWRRIAALLNSDGGYEIFSGVDYLYRDVYFSIVNYDETTQESLYYNQDEDSWKYFVDMENTNEDGEVQKIIDWYGWVGQSFFAFMEGNMFQFNKAESAGQPIYSTLFKINETDPLKELVVETIAMIDDDKIMVFLSSWIRANQKVSLVEITISANTMDKSMYPNGMYTVLKPGNYSIKEGVLYAEIKRDMFTSGIPATEAARRQAIANGRPMRGHVALVRIHFSTDEYVRLYSTGVGMIPSELS